MKKVLITNFGIVQFTGSEINTSTIAKRLKEIGYEVYLGVIETDSPLYDVVKENFDHVIYLLENDFDFSKTEFDLVWTHHSFLLDWLIFEKGLKAKKIITSSLSPNEPFESAPIYANELSLTIANSPETYEQLTKVEDVKNVYLFENYSFSSYFNKNINIKELKNIAVVSNHIPEEEMQAIELLREKKYNVDIYGFAGTQTLITNEILEKYDCIVTIGKTVQYAMSLKIPVYIYDIHGGDGYLTIENMEQNRSHNFSGRGFDKKDANTIANEIIENFEKELEQLEDIKQYALSNFNFEQKIDEILHKVEEMPEVDLNEIRNKYNKFKRNMLTSKRLAEREDRRRKEILNQKTIEFYQIKEKELAEKQTEIDNRGYIMNKQEEEISKLKEEKKALELEVKEIKNSRSWRYTQFFRKNK